MFCPDDGTKIDGYREAGYNTYYDACPVCGVVWGRIPPGVYVTMDVKRRPPEPAPTMLAKPEPETEWVSECCGVGPAAGTELSEGTYMGSEYKMGFCGRCRDGAGFVRSERSDGPAEP